MSQLLVIDIGNSNTVVGVMDNGRVLASARMATVPGDGISEMLTNVRSVLRDFRTRYPVLRGGIMSSVVPELTQAVCDVVSRVTGIGLMVMGDAGLSLGMEICVDHPERVGHDRIADAIGAISRYPCPLVVVDMGTATTVNVVDTKGRFVGGMIIPGVRTSFDALCSRASQLSEVPLRVPARLIGKNTAESMQSGVTYGNALMIEGLVSRIVDELQTDATIVMTGGLAPLVSPLVRREVVYDEFLLFRGLCRIYARNEDAWPHS